MFGHPRQCAAGERVQKVFCCRFSPFAFLSTSLPAVWQTLLLSGIVVLPLRTGLLCSGRQCRSTKGQGGENGNCCLLHGVDSI
jgi:hypothetical protein